MLLATPVTIHAATADRTHVRRTPERDRLHVESKPPVLEKLWCVGIIEMVSSAHDGWVAWSQPAS